MTQPIALLFFLFFSLLANAQDADNEQEPLFIVGSTSMAKLVEATQAAFFKQTGVSILVRPIGSETGIVSIGEGVSDIGIVSRFLTSDEQAKWPHLSQITVAQDAIVFISHVSNPVTNFSFDEVITLYTNQSPSNSVLFSKDQRHGTHQSFLDYFELESMPAPLETDKLVFKPRGINKIYGQVKAKTFNQVNQAVANVSRIDNAIAFESLGAFMVYNQKGNTSKVKLLSLDNQPPIINQQVNSHYSFKRPLNIVVSQAPSKQSKSYLDFLLSEQGQALLKKHYFIPVKAQ